MRSVTVVRGHLDPLVIIHLQQVSEHLIEIAVRFNESKPKWSVNWIAKELR